jgi:LEA14-like dessication related protein
VMHIHLRNPNSFPIDIENMKYRAEIGNNIRMEGEKKGLLDVPALAEANIDLPLRVQFGKAGKTILEVLIHGDNLDYHLEQDFIISSKSKALNNCRVHINKDGKVRSLLRLRDKQKQKREQDAASNKEAQKG